MEEARSQRGSCSARIDAFRKCAGKNLLPSYSPPSRVTVNQKLMIAFDMRVPIIANRVSEYGSKHSVGADLFVKHANNLANKRFGETAAGRAILERLRNTHAKPRLISLAQ